jgi:hypothetical protein
MTRITIDSATAAKLDGLGQKMEFYDESGNLLGRFEPDENSPIRQWLREVEAELPLSELEQRVSAGNGLTTDEVLARLRGRKP